MRLQRGQLSPCIQRAEWMASYYCIRDVGSVPRSDKNNLVQPLCLIKREIILNSLLGEGLRLFYSMYCLHKQGKGSGDLPLV